MKTSYKILTIALIVIALSFLVYAAKDVVFTGDTTIVGNLNVTGNFVSTGNMSVKRPYGMFSDVTNQVVAVANTAYPVNFSTTEDSYEVYITSDRQNFSVAQNGDYLIELSAIADVDTPNKALELWPQINGVNVNRSNTKVVLPTATTATVISVPFILDLRTTDTFRIMYASDDAGSRLIYTDNTSYSPSTPSIIMTVSKISEIT